MKDPISVEVRFARDGSITPLNFIWRGQNYAVSSLGRRWEEDGARHYLVMDTHGEVYEIAFFMQEGYWRLCKAPTRRARPGRPI